jgi:hypothetical protein
MPPVKRILIGLLVMVVSEIGMLWKLEPFWSWHTPIAWTGYIVFVDGLVYARRGRSWLSDSPAEFAFLAVVSFPLWLVFEFYNLFIRNWHYVNLPESAFWRDVGYVWAFATIWPAIFETAELVASFRARQRNPADAGSRTTGRRPRASARGQEEGRGQEGPKLKLGAYGKISILAGAGMLAWPLVWPSPYLAAPVWLGFIFLLDPLNARAGRPSLTADYRLGRLERATNLMAGGLVCGLVWECWNYWARTKWVYTVPILERVRLFEMPLPGYFGFPAFALECFTMYVTLRLILRRSHGRAVAL